MTSSFLDSAALRSRDAAAQLAGPRRPAAGAGSSCAGGACAAAPTYEPLHPEFFEAVFRHEWLSEPFAAALRDGSEAALRSVLCHEVPDRVVSFEMFRPSFCEALVEELLHYEACGMPVTRPNSMNAYGVIVNEIGMRPLIDDLQLRHLLPLTRLLFPEEGGGFTKHHSFMVTHHEPNPNPDPDPADPDPNPDPDPNSNLNPSHAFVPTDIVLSTPTPQVRYKQGEDLGLDMHHDDSDVTLNVCLGRQFTGATLSFCGGFGATDHRKHTHTYHHRVGRAVLHLGTHRHGADDIVSGERYNLIVWSHGPYRETAAYKEAQRRQGSMHGADAAPDPVCLSYTHDPDYGEYRAYPKGRQAKPEARRMHLARFSAQEAAVKAAELKARGTADYGEQSWGAAACKYACAADYAASSGTSYVGHGLLSSLQLNEAQCHLKLSEAPQAVELCSRVLERDPANVKGLYRRALAHAQLAEYGAAMADLVAAARAEPSNRAVRVELDKCRAAASSERAKEKRLFAKMLGGAGGVSAAAAAAAAADAGGGWDWDASAKGHGTSGTGGSGSGGGGSEGIEG